MNTWYKALFAVLALACTDNGNAADSRQPCTWGGKTYAPGQTFACDCNSCQCVSGQQISSTLMLCHAGGSGPVGGQGPSEGGLGGKSAGAAGSLSTSGVTSFTAGTGGAENGGATGDGGAGGNGGTGGGSASTQPWTTESERIQIAYWDWGTLLWRVDGTRSDLSPEQLAALELLVPNLRRQPLATCDGLNYVITITDRLGGGRTYDSWPSDTCGTIASASLAPFLATLDCPARNAATTAADALEITPSICLDRWQQSAGGAMPMFRLTLTDRLQCRLRLNAPAPNMIIFDAAGTMEIGRAGSSSATQTEITYELTFPAAGDYLIQVGGSYAGTIVGDLRVTCTS